MLRMSYLHGRGVGVVGGLRQIDVVIGVAVFVFALLVAHQFEGDVGDDLVGVHVGGGAGSALYHVHNELVVELAVAYHAACLYDGVGSLFVEQSQVAVRQCGGLFHVGQGLMISGKKLSLTRLIWKFSIPRIVCTPK